MVKNDNDLKFFKTFFDDLRKFFKDLFSGEIFKKFKRDFREIRTFFLDQQRERRLVKMGRFKRFFYLITWLFKSMFFSLSSFRRILLIFAIIFLISQNNGNQNGKAILGFFLLFFIILLELKDKLLARDELEEGRSIQEALIPDRSPLIPGWDVWLYTRPANDVGGDLVDFIQIDPNRFGLAIGDVAGKGLPAALLMAKLQSTLRAIAPDFTSLKDLAKKLNRIFCRDSLPNRFASMIYLEISPDNDTIRFVNAGHLPPLIIKKDQLDEMDKGAPALGIMPDSDYIEHHIVIQPGEIFIVYSDGVTEARNEDGAFFGENNLKSLLSGSRFASTKETGEAILNEINVFIGEAAATDDLSLVIIRRKNS